MHNFGITTIIIMDINEDDIRERLQRLMATEGVSQAEFSKKIGRQASNMSAILNPAGKSGRNIPRGLVNDVVAAFPNISREWVMFGEGEMYKRDIIIEKEDEEMVPRLPMNVSGHCICEYLKGTKRLLCDERPRIKQFPDYDFTLILKDDSMGPRYVRGDEIALKKVDNSEWEKIEWGHEYVVDSKELGPRFKIIYEKGSNLVMRSFDEKRYPDFLIPKKDVCAIYKLVGMIRL